MLTLLTLLAGGTMSQRLVSKLPARPIQPAFSWVWGRLLGGRVYRAPQQFGGEPGGISTKQT